MIGKVSKSIGGDWFGQLAANRLLRSFGLLGTGEAFNRVSRIVTTIVLARYLGPVEFGIAATAITCFELVRVLANNGLSQLVVRAPAADLAKTCNTAYRILVPVCLAMALIQIAAGAALAWYMARPEIFVMIVCLAGVYAVMPASMVHYWLLQRDYRMGTVAGINAVQVSLDNILTAALAIAGFGAWAIVAPKLLTAPVWLIGMRRAVSWQFKPAAGQLAMLPTSKFCGPILASEMLVAVRGNADNMLVGMILGLEALGIYYFAFSAGYGLSSVLTNALAAVSFRHLADPEKGRVGILERFDYALVRLALPIGGLIALQALLVPVYVPIVFGAKWEPVVLIVSVLCLSATTRAVFDLAAQLLRAGGLEMRELIASALFTVALLASFAAALPFGLATGVGVLCLSTVSLQLAFCLWARRSVGASLVGAAPVAVGKKLMVGP